jgi:hypothetical protein
MPFKDKTKNTNYQREWARRKHKGIPTKIVNAPKLTPEERRTRNLASRRKSNKEHRKFVDSEIDRLVGSKCAICKSNQYLICHRKNGIKHPKGKEYVFKHPEEFVRVCLPCHKPIHWAMKYFNMSWNQILNTIEHP